MRVRVELSPFLMALVTEAGRLTGVSDKEAFARLLKSIELHARLDKLDLGLEWSEAAKAACEQMEERSARAVFPDIDLTLLESGKSRSGFVSVYFANGKFRAIVPDPAQGMGSRTLSGRATALEAAIDRYRWYEEHGLPYGNLGWHVANHREQHPDKSEEEALLWARDLVASGTYGLKRPFTFEQVERTLRALRKRLGIVAPDDGALYGGITATKAPEGFVLIDAKPVTCAVCTETIHEGEATRPHSSGPNEWAHASCDDVAEDDGMYHERP